MRLFEREVSKREKQEAEAILKAGQQRAQGQLGSLHQIEGDRKFTERMVRDLQQQITDLQQQVTDKDLLEMQKKPEAKTKALKTGSETRPAKQLQRDLDSLRASNEALKKKNDTVAVDAAKAKQSNTEAEVKRLRGRIQILLSEHQVALAKVSEA